MIEKSRLKSFGNQFAVDRTRSFRRRSVMPQKSIPSQSDRLAFWKFAYARSAFIEASTYVEAATGAETMGAIHRALTVGIVVAYCRPFKQRKQVRLGEDIVPPEFRAVHDDAIVIRDKIVAHRDVDGPVAEWGLASQVRLHFDDKGFFVHTLSPYAMEELLPKLGGLTRLLIKVCDAEIGKFVSQSVPKMPPGEYVVSLEEQPAQWLKKEEF